MKHYALLLLLHVLSTSCMENDTTPTPSRPITRDTSAQSINLSVQLESGSQDDLDNISDDGENDPMVTCVTATMACCSLTTICAILSFWLLGR